MTEHNRDMTETVTPSSGWRRFLSFFTAAPEPSAAHRLYSKAVNHARYPLYYEKLGVPDTPEGRFEILALHVGLIIRRLVEDRAAGDEVAQALVNLMISDLDDNLRELGVGDLSVGKQVKRLASQFNARMDVLAKAFDGDDRECLRPMLMTNMYHGIASPSVDDVSALMRICEVLESRLKRQSIDDLAKGEIDLPSELDLHETCGLA